MKIINYPNKILRQPCTRYSGDFDDSLKKISDQMFKVMKKNDGLGLSANQVGLDFCISVIDLSPMEKEKNSRPIVLINPQITKSSQKIVKLEEGCLSLPNLFGEVERPEKIKIEYQNLFGKKITLKAEGLLARVLQHELDHLSGKLFIDKVLPGTLREITPEQVCQDLNIVFIGTSGFGLPALELLMKNKIIPKLIITEPDKPAGRGKNLTSSPVKEYAKKFHLPAIQPIKISSAYKKIKDVKPDLLVVASYGQMIPEKIIKTATLGAINLHPSLLPKYRGPTPIQTALLNREKDSGISIFLLDEKMDHGPIIVQKKMAIDENDTAASLESKLAKLAGNQLVRIIVKFALGKIKPKNQNEKSATYTNKIKKEDGKIDFSKKPAEINAQIKAYKIWPRSFVILNGKRVIIDETHLDDDELVIDKVQPEGKKIMNFSDFLRGNPKALDFFKKINYIKIT